MSFGILWALYFVLGTSFLQLSLEYFHDGEISIFISK